MIEDSVGTGIDKIEVANRIYRYFLDHCQRDRSRVSQLSQSIIPEEQRAAKIDELKSLAEVERMRLELSEPYLLASTVGFVSSLALRAVVEGNVVPYWPLREMCEMHIRRGLGFEPDNTALNRVTRMVHSRVSRELRTPVGSESQWY